MKYVIKEKFWSWGNDFHIYNTSQEPVFFVDGVAFSWGNKLSFQDLNGNELAFISQKLLTWKPCYEINRRGRKFAEVIKEFSWFKQSFTLDVPGPNDYTVTGSFWAHDYEFIRQGKVVARVNKTLWTWQDTYGIDIHPEEDDVAILCTAIVIDQVLHDQKN